MNLSDRLHRYEAHVPLFLRFGLGLIFFWFGVDKFIHPTFWISYVPPWAVPLIPLSLESFNIVQGVVETIIGTLLIVGLWRQSVAGIAGLIMIPIIIATFSLGLYDIAVRDIGLFFVALSLAVTQETILSVDTWLNQRRHLKHTRIHGQ